MIIRKKLSTTALLRRERRKERENTSHVLGLGAALNGMTLTLDIDHQIIVKKNGIVVRGEFAGKMIDGIREELAMLCNDGSTLTLERLRELTRTDNIYEIIVRFKKE